MVSLRLVMAALLEAKKKKKNPPKNPIESYVKQYPCASAHIGFPRTIQ